MNEMDRSTPWSESTATEANRHATIIIVGVPLDHDGLYAYDRIDRHARPDSDALQTHLISSPPLPLPQLTREDSRQ